MTKVCAGISSIGISFPPMFLSVSELAKLRKVDPEKFTIGLGCKDIAVCPSDCSVVQLGVEAAKRALSRWDGDIKDIGLIAVGTESGLDMSRPLSNYIAEMLGLKGNIRSYEVKHACYGGTVAIRQALEWKLSGVAKNKAALVIAVDEALYEHGDPGEPTQGAGAIALIIDKPDIAVIEPASYSWCKPVFDFWRPVGESYPRVDGKLSIECYKEAAKSCFLSLISEKKMSLTELISSFHAFCFHTPYPKMVQKAFTEICTLEDISEEQALSLFNSKIYPTLAWNVLSGNSYTASLWISVAKTLAGLQNGRSITAFSYGSGCGAELLVLNAREKAEAAGWKEDIIKHMDSRIELTADEYLAIRK